MNPTTDATPIVVQPIPIPDSLESVRATLTLARAALAPRQATPATVAAYNAIGEAIVALERAEFDEFLEEVTAP